MRPVHLNVANPRGVGSCCWLEVWHSWQHLPLLYASHIPILNPPGWYLGFGALGVASWRSDIVDRVISVVCWECLQQLVSGKSYDTIDRVISVGNVGKSYNTIDRVINVGCYRIPPGAITAIFDELCSSSAHQQGQHLLKGLDKGCVCLALVSLGV